METERGCCYMSGRREWKINARHRSDMKVSTVNYQKTLMPTAWYTFTGSLLGFYVSSSMNMNESIWEWISAEKKICHFNAFLDYVYFSSQKRVSQQRHEKWMKLDSWLCNFILPWLQHCELKNIFLTATIPKFIQYKMQFS